MSMIEKKKLGAEEKILELIFMTSFGARASVSLFAMSKLVEAVNGKDLHFYFSTASGITFISSILIFLGANSFKSIYRFLILHTLCLSIAALAFFSQNQIFVAQLVFLSILGSRTVNNYSNWSLAHTYVRPSRVKHVFAHLAAATQIGSLVGSSLVVLLSMAGVNHQIFLLMWGGAELMTILAGLILRVRYDDGDQGSDRDVSMFKKQWKNWRNYRLLPFLGAWNFVWGFLFISLDASVGGRLESLQDTDVHYGMMGIGTALCTVIMTKFIYPTLVKKLRLDNLYLFLSFTLIGTVAIFRLSMGTGAASLTFIWINLAQIVIGVGLSTTLTLYPKLERDRLRICTDTLCFALGGQAAGLFVNDRFLVIALVLIFVLSFGIRYAYRLDLDYFLKHGNLEGRQNAIFMLDQLDEPLSNSQLTKTVA